MFTTTIRDDISDIESVTSGATASTMQDLFHNPLFGEFSDPGFSDSTFIAKAVKNAADSLSQLNSCLTKIDSEITNQVSKRRAALLTQSTSISNVETELTDVRQKISNMQESVQNMASQIEQPYTDLVEKVDQIETIHLAQNCLNKVLRLTTSMTKLHTAMKKKPDMCKAATHVRDISLLLKDRDPQIEAVFNSLKVVKNKIPELEANRTFIISHGRAQLLKSVKELHQINMGNALQIFFNLGGEYMQEAIFSVFEALLKDTESLILKLKIVAGDPSGIKGSTGQFWEKVGTTFEKLLTLIAGVWTLERVLGKKLDTESHEPLILRLAPQHRLVLKMFWHRFVTTLGSSFEQLSTQSKFASRVLINNYPQLHVQICKLFEQTTFLDRTAKADKSASLKVWGEADFKALNEAVAPFGNRYENKMKSAIHKPLELFSTKMKNSLPTTADMGSWAQMIASEVMDVADVPQMHQQAAIIVNNALDTFTKSLMIPFAKRLKLSGGVILLDGKSSVECSEFFLLLDILSTKLESLISSQALIKRLNMNLLKKCAFVCFVAMLPPVSLILKATKNKPVMGGYLGGFRDRLEDVITVAQSFQTCGLKTSGLKNWCQHSLRSLLIVCQQLKLSSEQFRHSFAEELSQFLFVFQTLQDEHKLEKIDEIEIIGDFKRMLAAGLKSIIDREKKDHVLFWTMYALGQLKLDFLPMHGNSTKLLEWYRQIGILDKHRILRNKVSIALEQSERKSENALLLRLLQTYSDHLLSD